MHRMEKSDFTFSKFAKRRPSSHKTEPSEVCIAHCIYKSYRITSVELQNVVGVTLNNGTKAKLKSTNKSMVIAFTRKFCRLPISQVKCVTWKITNLHSFHASRTSLYLDDLVNQNRSILARFELGNTTARTMAAAARMWSITIGVCNELYDDRMPRKCLPSPDAQLSNEPLTMVHCNRTL